MALSLGKTLGELADQMCDGELESWLAYYELEPFGPQADWVMNARILQALHGGKLEDYLLES